MKNTTTTPRTLAHYAFSPCSLRLVGRVLWLPSARPERAPTASLTHSLASLSLVQPSLDRTASKHRGPRHSRQFRGVRGTLLRTRLVFKTPEDARGTQRLTSNPAALPCLRLLYFFMFFYLFNFYLFTNQKRSRIQCRRSGNIVSVVCSGLRRHFRQASRCLMAFRAHDDLGSRN